MQTKALVIDVIKNTFEFYIRRMTPTYVRRHISSFRKKIAKDVHQRAPTATWDTSSDYDVAQVILAKHKILRYLDVQLRRAHQWASSDIDMLAWSTRNIMEVTLWLDFLAEDPKNVKLFIRDECIDLHELAELNLACLDELQPSSNASQALKLLKAMKRYKHIRFKDKIASDKGLTLQFKICSKLLHPTALSISSLPEQAASPLRTQILLQIDGDLKRLMAALKTISQYT
jgi:hypothetical protein